ncbi:MAG TPA: NAD-dependent epimerase/dehydratase family protein [Gemmatimonadaceae bacterium]|nr:NAD-dependent epimerase/dehydratase family protein [Gemmatimonadaceae bacterium]
MRVLVTGGTGVVGQAAVTELLKRGHGVRLVSRKADEDARQWPAKGDAAAGVEAWPASVSEQSELKGCADGCDLVLHLAGIVEESPPEVTFENTNVEGTRAILREAERARVGRFIYVSSLGAEAGQSPYHRSKRRAEDIVRNFAGGWIILRPGNVYGPGDEVVSVLLTMVRTLPVVPVVGSGDDKFQPIWVGDLAVAIAACVERTDLHGRVLDLAGPDVTSINDLLTRLGEITDRAPARIPVPGFLVGAGATIAGMLGAKLPINENQLTMLSEENVIRTPGGNALTGVLQITPTSLDSGLRRLADAQPEQTPDKGVGALKRKRYWADISGSQLTAEELFARLRVRFGELTPLHMDLNAEPGTASVLNKGTTITMSLPVRGNVQVRVEQLTPNKATLVTLAGHPLCGAMRLISEQRGDSLRFEVQVFDRPANLADWLAMRTVGDGLQNQTWESLVEAMVAESGGTRAGPVQSEETDLDEYQAERVEDWLKALIAERKLSQNSGSAGRKEQGKSKPATRAEGAEATL